MTCQLESLLAPITMRPKTSARENNTAGMTLLAASQKIYIWLKSFWETCFMKIYMILIDYPCLSLTKLFWPQFFNQLSCRSSQPLHREVLSCELERFCLYEEEGNSFCAGFPEVKCSFSMVLIPYQMHLQTLQFCSHSV